MLKFIASFETECNIIKRTEFIIARKAYEKSFGVKLIYTTCPKKNSWSRPVSFPIESIESGFECYFGSKESYNSTSRCLKIKSISYHLFSVKLIADEILLQKFTVQLI